MGYIVILLVFLVLAFLIQPPAPRNLRIGIISNDKPVIPRECEKCHQIHEPHCFDCDSCVAYRKLLRTKET